MKALFDLYERGGPVMIAIVGLSVVLYARCFQLLLWLRQEHRGLRHGPAVAAAELPALLLVYLAHRAVHKNLQQLNRLEAGLREGAAS